MSYDDTAGYAVTVAPTMRMLVDLGDLDASRWVNQSGVSGHAFSPHYDDQTELWATNRTWGFVSSAPAVEAGTVLVRIGEENAHEALTGASLVTVGYGSRDRALGGLGIVGPTRMDYPTNMAAVRAVARYVGQILAES